jgi:ABC-type uncharacterized transport system permease subunit
MLIGRKPFVTALSSSCDAKTTVLKTNIKTVKIPVLFFYNILKFFCAYFIPCCFATKHPKMLESQTNIRGHVRNILIFL